MLIMALVVIVSLSSVANANDGKAKLKGGPAELGFSPAQEPAAGDIKKQLHALSASELQRPRASASLAKDMLHHGGKPWHKGRLRINASVRQN